MAGTIYDWSTTASDNASADEEINWREGQPPSTVNNSARQMMGRVAEWISDIGGTLTAGGSANALTLTANSAFTAYRDGMMVAFRASATNTGAATLSVNGIGTKGIRKLSYEGDVVLDAGDIQAGCLCVVMYNSALEGDVGGWQLMDRPERQPSPPRNDYVPTGAILPFAGHEGATPDGFLICAGQAVSRTTYGDLFSVISTVYGDGDGSTTFNLPDLRGRVVAGADNMNGNSAGRLTSATMSPNGNARGATGGNEQHTLTTGQMPSHNHAASTNTAGDHTHQYSDRGGVDVSVPSGVGPGVVGIGSTTRATQSAGSHSHTVTIQNRGGGNPHNNVQPTIVLNYIIRT